MSEFPSLPAADIPAGATLLDVRDQYEYDAGHAPQALHLPVTELPQRFDTELDPDTDYYVICRTGGRSHQAAAWLNDHGYSVIYVSGGYDAWLQTGQQLQASSGQDARIL